MDGRRVELEGAIKTQENRLKEVELSYESLLIKYEDAAASHQQMMKQYADDIKSLRGELTTVRAELATAIDARDKALEQANSLVFRAKESVADIVGAAHTDRQEARSERKKAEELRHKYQIDMFSAERMLEEATKDKAKADRMINEARSILAKANRAAEDVRQSLCDAEARIVIADERDKLSRELFEEANARMSMAVVWGWSSFRALLCLGRCVKRSGFRLTTSLSSWCC